MKNLTVAQAARQLGISQYSILNYLTKGKLSGDAQAGLVDAESLHIYRASITPRHAEIVKVLAADFDITERERDILERRARFEKLDEIGAAHKITKSRVSAIIKKVLQDYSRNGRF